MKLRKHLGAKVATVAASLVALVSTLVLVHRNPPAAADSPPSEAAATTTPARRGIERFGGTTESAPSTHTRTHVS
jgi:hypothetical protein